MKFKTALLSLAVVTSLLVGCKPKTPVTPTPAPAPSIGATKTTSPIASPAASPATSPKPDTVTGASVAKDEATLIKAASKDGSWIVILTHDLTVTKDVVLEGDFTIADKNDPTKKVPTPRKIALYNQDDKKVKTASYTLKAPKLIVKSKDTIIKGGIFAGDVYVESAGFTLDDAKIDGNLYFATEDLKASFKSQNNSSVTGKTEIKKHS